jgi:uncharacterized protein YqiB (DUF1249 family)
MWNEKIRRQRKLFEELHNLYYTHFLRLLRLMPLMWNMREVANEYTFKLRRLRWVEHIAYTGLDRCMHNFG